MTSPSALLTEIREIQAADTYPLRAVVLRNMPAATAVPFDQDALEGAFHLGGFEGGSIVGVVSLYPVARPEEPGMPLYQLRGMAVDAGLQGCGVGGKLLAEAIAALRRRHAPGVWCNARIAAAGFYRSHGFRQCSEEFDIPGIGPHIQMKLLLDA
jgi:predicted GNAT family N-acyltransferase